MDIYSTFLRICTLTRALRDIRQTLQGPRDMIYWGVWEFEEFRTSMTLQNIVSQRSKPTSKALVIQSFNPFCSFLFLRSSCCSWLYNLPGSWSQDPGRKFFPVFLPFIPKVAQETPGARRASQLRIKRQTSAVFYIREFGSLRTGRRAPSPGTYPQVIHRLYTLGSLGSLNNSPNLWVNSVLLVSQKLSHTSCPMHSHYLHQRVLVPHVSHCVS